MHLNKNISCVCFLFFLVSCGGGSEGVGSIDTALTPSPSIDSFTASQSTASVNDTINLSWTSSNAVTCSASGDWSDSIEVYGVKGITLTTIKTYTFELACTGFGKTVLSSLSVLVIALDDSNIYDEDKDSYCRTPSNTTSEYWIEDFDSNILDSELFTYQLGNGFNASDGSWVGGWGNNELQYYTGPGTGNAKNYKQSTNTTENLFIENGFLKIQPIFDNTDLFKDPYCSTRSCNYTWPHTSARIITSSKKIFQKASIITVCFKLPDGTGHWPATWMLPEGFIDGSKTWPYNGEIDIMESRGRISNEISSTIHFGTVGNNEMISKNETVPLSVNFHGKFHSITFEWKENSIKMFLDTHQSPFFEATSDSTEFNNNFYPFNDNFFLILNVASGGNYDGGQIDTTKFCKDESCSNLTNPDSGRMLIDFIEYKSID